MARKIDLTPTWRGAMPVLIAALEDGTEKGRILARAELMELAGKLDGENAALAKTPRLAVGDSILSLGGETDCDDQDMVRSTGPNATGSVVGISGPFPGQGFVYSVDFAASGVSVNIDDNDIDKDPTLYVLHESAALGALREIAQASLAINTRLNAEPNPQPPTGDTFNELDSFVRDAASRVLGIDIYKLSTTG